jgi:hypothetical protein
LLGEVFIVIINSIHRIVERQLVNIMIKKTNMTPYPHKYAENLSH